MLFGRKTSPAGAPPAGAPKPEADALRPAVSAGAPVGAPVGQPAPAAPAVTMMPIQPSAQSPAPAHAPVAAAPAQPAFSDTYSDPYSDKGPQMNASTPKPPTAPTMPGAGFKTDVPRRVVDVPGAAPRRPDGFGAPAAAPAAPAPIAPAAPLASEQRRLIVGRDISLSGEIGSCDVLVVEGTVEAKLRDGRSIEIADSGLFKGSVEIDEADIGGRFEGDLTVRGRLTVRSSGKITGSIKYGELAVEAGGQLIGDVQYMAPGAKPAAVVTPAATVAPVAAPAMADGE